MKRIGSLASQALLLAHRWLGIAGCLLFAAWFLSGIVMMYARMPELSREERLARMRPLDLSTARRSPADAAATAGIRGGRLSISMRGTRPVYRFTRGRDESIVFADTGEAVRETSVEDALQAATVFAPAGSHPRHLGLLTTPDQWTLQDRGRMPMHRFALDDGAGTELYVSVGTGDVVLRTTRRERLWAYAGPVIHWFYFTPLRQNGALWNAVVVWSSVAGCVVAVSGLAWGLMRFSPTRRFRVGGAPAVSPYAGIMRWHHYAGLVFGVVTFTWVYSGLLSMEPFGWFETEGMTRAQREAVTGGMPDLTAISLDDVRAATATISKSFPPRELTLLSFRGQPYWTADEAPPSDRVEWWHAERQRPRAVLPRLARRYVPAANPAAESFTAFDRVTMETLSREVMPEATVEKSEWLEDYDGYYYDSRRERPLPVLRVQYGDARTTWMYFSPARGDIVGRYDRVSRLQRWLYHGLHSLDAPFLYFRRPLWDLAVILLSLGGFASSATSLLPAWRRLSGIARRSRSRRNR